MTIATVGPKQAIMYVKLFGNQELNVFSLSEINVFAVYSVCVLSLIKSQDVWVKPTEDVLHDYLWCQIKIATLKFYKTCKF